MKHLDLTLESPAENLACDETLLDWCEASEGPELLRFWEPRQPFVVLGYGNQAASEVNLAACHGLQVPILRRISGGGAVLQGAGCLNYALVLEFERDRALASITQTNRYVLGRHREALARVLGREVSVQGATDLCLDGCHETAAECGPHGGAVPAASAGSGRKFSGNSQRRKRRCLLFHGTFLLHADLALIETLLHVPARQPQYRGNRAHVEFLVNLRLRAETVKAALRQAWEASEPAARPPLDQVVDLARVKYSAASWNLRV